jgi:hypothetical protein
VKIALIVEGQSDQESLPTLVAKVGELLQTQIFAPRPIRAGPYSKLGRQGALERYVELAASRDVESILIITDLDDGCPVEAARSWETRRSSLEVGFGIPINICLIKREFETWFLQNLTQLMQVTPEYGWKDQVTCPNPDEVRGAKEFLHKNCAKGYREVIDQPILVKKLDLLTLYNRDRSFRKFAKSVSGIGYADLDIAFAQK